MSLTLPGFQYAVNHLAVPSIVVCGHSGCAAMHGLLDGASLNGSLGSWLRWGVPSLDALRAGHLDHRASLRAPCHDHRI